MSIEKIIGLGTNLAKINSHGKTIIDVTVLVARLSKTFSIEPGILQSVINEHISTSGSKKEDILGDPDSLVSILRKVPNLEFKVAPKTILQKLQEIDLVEAERKGTSFKVLHEGIDRHEGKRVENNLIRNIVVHLKPEVISLQIKSLDHVDHVVNLTMEGHSQLAADHLFIKEIEYFPEVLGGVIR